MWLVPDHRIELPGRLLLMAAFPTPERAASAALSFALSKAGNGAITNFRLSKLLLRFVMSCRLHVQSAYFPPYDYGRT